MPVSRRWEKRKNAVVRWLVWFHRWLGLATCLIFALWFASGAVLLFEPFPSLPPSQAQAIAAPIDMTGVRLSPAEALRVAGSGGAIRLRQRADEPAYIIGTSTGPAVVGARSGRLLPLLSAAGAAQAVHGAGPVKQVVGPFDYDQWVVHDQFDPLRPFYRVDLASPAGTQLYVSARTGDIVQRTTARQRMLNWVGAVLHWAYFTPLRSSFTAWDRSVWIVSFVAMWVAVAGMALGIIRTIDVRRAGRKALTFYRLRWMRWHHLVGLFAGIFVVTWILSGWLSMDHGRLFSRGRATPAQLAAYAGLSPEAAARAVPTAVLQHFPGTREFRFAAVGSTPLVAVTAPSGETKPYTVTGMPMPPDQLDHLIGDALATAWGGLAPAAGTAVPQDDFYSLAEGMPGSARRFAGSGSRPTIYVDGADGHIVTVMNTSRAAYAWVYYGLHSFNFPGIARHQVIRDILVLIPLIAGLLFSITGMVLGYQRLRKSLRA